MSSLARANGQTQPPDKGLPAVCRVSCKISCKCGYLILPASVAAATGDWQNVLLMLTTSAKLNLRPIPSCVGRGGQNNHAMHLEK